MSFYITYVETDTPTDVTPSTWTEIAQLPFPDTTTTITAYTTITSADGSFNVVNTFRNGAIIGATQLQTMVTDPLTFLVQFVPNTSYVSVQVQSPNSAQNFHTFSEICNY